jgi:predicted nucleic acid-binding protein
MRRLFVDTSAYFALTNKRDENKASKEIAVFPSNIDPEKQ